MDIDKYLQEFAESMRAIPIDDLFTHPEWACTGQVCCVHNPTDHVMKDFKQVWRPDRRIIERVCEHGVGHPDPDDFNIRNMLTDSIHGCDGCCAGVEYPRGPEDALK